MVSPYDSPLLGRILVVVLLLATPAVAFVLVAGMVATGAGPGSWLVFVVAPLAVLGAGVLLVARSAGGGSSGESRNEPV